MASRPLATRLPRQASTAVRYRPGDQGQPLRQLSRSRQGPSCRSPPAVCCCAACPPRPAAGPLRVDRRVDCRGALVVAGQKIHVGARHAGQTLTVEAADTTFRIYEQDNLIAEVARTATKPITRFKVRKPEEPRRAAREPRGRQGALASGRTWG